jgi:CHASE2 domain-containing sensor protein
MMTPYHYLKFGGLLLIILAVLGGAGILGPTATQSVFGTAWWLDYSEIIIYLVLGIVDVIVANKARSLYQYRMVTILGFLSLLMAGHTYIVGGQVVWAEFQIPGDLIFFIVFGVWGVAAGAQYLKQHQKA